MNLSCADTGMLSADDLESNPAATVMEMYKRLQSSLEKLHEAKVVSDATVARLSRENKELQQHQEELKRKVEDEATALSDLRQEVMLLSLC